jgi:hypothetical protein
MDLIAKYTIESTIWWDDGQGVRVDEKGRRTPNQPKLRKQQIPMDNKRVAGHQQEGKVAAP